MKYKKGPNISGLNKNIKLQFFYIIKKMKECPYLARCRDCRIGVNDREGRLVVINNRIKEIYGDITGQNGRDYLAREDVEISKAACEKTETDPVENLFLRYFDPPFGNQWGNVSMTKRCPETGFSLFIVCPLPGTRNIISITDKNKNRIPRPGKSGKKPSWISVFPGKV